MIVYQVSREFAKYAAAGGLTEVVYGLAKNLPAFGIKSSVFIPLYGFINKNNLLKIHSFFLDTNIGKKEIKVYHTNEEQVDIYFISFDLLYDKKSVYTYTNEDELENSEHERGKGFIDNDDINLVFQLSVTFYMANYLASPDILILHDGHTGLIPLVIKSNWDLSFFFMKSKLIFLLHNSGEGYHQKVNIEKVQKYFNFNRLDIEDVIIDSFIDPIFIASLYCTPVTVSPFFAKEIISLEHDKWDGGYGRFCLANKVHLLGITNGIDITMYIDSKSSNSKSYITSDAFKSYGFDIFGGVDRVLERPLFLFQNRITEQKGIDILIYSIKCFLQKQTDANFVIMGQGEKHLEEDLSKLAQEYPLNVMYIQGYERSVSKELFKISDFFLLTSRWEPCGLTDMEASLYMSIPLVKNTGGLKKVIEGVSGFRFNTSSELIGLIEYMVIEYYTNHNNICQICENGKKYIMNNYSWEKVISDKYIPLFKELLQGE